jgi:hypothetical protein
MKLEKRGLSSILVTAVVVDTVAATVATTAAPLAVAIAIRFISSSKAAPRNNAILINISGRCTASAFNKLSRIGP